MHPTHGVEVSSFSRCRRFDSVGVELLSFQSQSLRGTVEYVCYGSSFGPNVPTLLFTSSYSLVCSFFSDFVALEPVLSVRSTSLSHWRCWWNRGRGRLDMATRAESSPHTTVRPVTYSSDTAMAQQLQALHFFPTSPLIMSIPPLL